MKRFFKILLYFLGAVVLLVGAFALYVNVHGIGDWTEQQFVDAGRYCKKPQGGLLHYPMAPHAGLREKEIKAIYAYLQTVPVIQNKVDRYQGK